MHRKNKLRVQCYNFIHNEMCKNRGHIPHWSVFVHRVFIRLAKQHLYTSNFTRLIMCQCKETRTAIPSTYYKNFNEAYVLNYYEDLTPPHQINASQEIRKHWHSQAEKVSCSFHSDRATYLTQKNPPYRRFQVVLYTQVSILKVRLYLG